MVIQPWFISLFLYLKPVVKGLGWALKVRKNQIWLMIVLILFLGGYLLYFWERQQQEIRQSLRTSLLIQQENYALWQKNQEVMVKYAQDYQAFEKSFWLKVHHLPKIEMIVRTLLQDQFLLLDEICGALLTEEQQYTLYKINVKLRSLSDEDVFHWLKTLNVPNVISIKHVHLQRNAQLYRQEIEYLKKNPEDDAPWLVRANISFVWLCWKHD